MSTTGFLYKTFYNGISIENQSQRDVYRKLYKISHGGIYVETNWPCGGSGGAWQVEAPVLPAGPIERTRPSVALRLSGVLLVVVALHGGSTVIACWYYSRRI